MSRNLYFASRKIDINMVKNSRIPFIGIVACLWYFITTIVLILTGTSVSMILTSVAHFINLAFIMPLMKAGIDIPIYLQIGQWPSALMTIDYLGWGFFMGAAFLSSSFAVAKKNSTLKYTLFVCGILCLMGLVGTVLVHANCWYIAPLGYGIGTAIVCIELIILNKAQA